MSLIEKLKAKCYKEFDVEKDVLDTFVKTNAKYWDVDLEKSKADFDLTDGQDGYIWLGLFMVEKWVSWMQPKFVYAQALSKKYNLKPIVLDWEENDELRELYASYGMPLICVKKRMYKNVSGMLYGMCRAIGAFLTCGTGKKIASLRYKGRKVGNYIYDTIIRTKDHVFTLEKGRSTLCFRKIFVTFWFLNTLEKIADEYQPKMYLYDDIVYDEGMIIQMMHRRHARVMKLGLTIFHREIPYSDTPQYWPDIFNQAIKHDFANMSDEEKQKYLDRANAELEERFKGKNGGTCEGELAFRNKQECTPEELKKIMGLDPNKKNIAIFSHCFSENPHKCSTQVYEDSYSWLRDTLKVIQGIDNVNWIVKSHPVAAAKYGEEGVVDGLYEQYKAPHIFLYPNEYNSNLIRGIADAIVTVYGTAGFEYSCLGIPTVHTGSATYTGFGFTTFTDTYDKYVEQLHHMDQVKPLTEEQKDMAKLVFVYHNVLRDGVYDEFDKKMQFHNQDCFRAYCDKEKMTKPNGEALQEIMAYMKDNEMTESIYYRLGMGD